MSIESSPEAHGAGFAGGMGDAYNEEAFRHVLAVERRRAARARRSVLLLLVATRAPGVMRPTIPAASAVQIFAGLRRSVREVDFIGWFREHRVAGVVLTQGAGTTTAEAVEQIGRRVTDTLTELVPPAASRLLHIRVLQLRPLDGG